MSQLTPSLPEPSREPSWAEQRAARREELAAAGGHLWSPLVWLERLKVNWKHEGAAGPMERSGYLFWGLTILLVLGVELLGALAATFRNWIPWPTISGTVGHLEKRWDWVAVIVVGLLSVVTFYALAPRERRREEDGRVIRAGGPDPELLPNYSPRLVFAVTFVAFLVPWLSGVSKFQLGYTIYGTLAIFGVLIPSLLAFWYSKFVGFPTLFFTIDKLRKRLHAVALVLVAGLAILTIHLAFYPWPDITHESATFAGLNAEQARNAAAGALRAHRQEKNLPPLAYSTQERGVADGVDTWFVYFRSNCVVQVAKGTTPSFSAQCS